MLRRHYQIPSIAPQQPWQALSPKDEAATERVSSLYETQTFLVSQRRDTRRAFRCTRVVGEQSRVGAAEVTRFLDDQMV